VASIGARVFVSSVVDGFEAYRAAAAEGICAAGAEPILVNEDFPSVPDSSRNACLDAVGSSDAFVLVIGERGGWKAPSGRFVTEEEYDEAVRRGIPLYVFLQDVARDPETERFEKRVSDYVLGRFRTSFRTPEELREAAKTALSTLPPARTRMVGSAITDALKGRSEQSQYPTLRLAIGSTRDGELVDPLSLFREEFQDEIIKIGTAKPHPIFGLRKEKTAEVQNGSLVITQRDERGSHASRWESRFVIGSSGVIIAETSIGERTESSSYGLSTAMTVQAKDLAMAAQTLFQFANGLLGFVDQFLRHRQLEYNAAVNNLGYRYIVDAAPKTGGGVPMRMGGDEPVTAFDTPRAITRETLSRPDAEIERVVEMLKHRAK
jgi:uncharacterized protein DUF4062